MDISDISVDLAHDDTRTGRPSSSDARRSDGPGTDARLAGTAAASAATAPLGALVGNPRRIRL